MHLAAQDFGQMHPDRHHQIRAPGFRLKVHQIAAQGRDRHTPGGGQSFRLGQAHRADVLGCHRVAELGQMHGVATFSLRQAQRLARG